MDYLVAISTWIVFGGIINFIFGAIIASKKKCSSLWPAPASMLRIIIIIYTIESITDLDIKNIIYPILCFFDIIWHLFFVYFLSFKFPIDWNPEKNPTLYKVWSTLGSTIFFILLIYNYFKA